MGNACCQKIPTQQNENQIDIIQDKKITPTSLYSQ